MRALVAALLLAALLAAAAQAAPSSGEARPCQGTELRGRVAGSSGAAGTITMSVQLRNSSGQACTTKGYPDLGLLKGRNSLPSRTQNGGSTSNLTRPVKKVTIPAGGYATVLVAYSDVPTGNETSCPNATALLVQLPGAGKAIKVRARIAPCNRGLLYTSPVLAGRVPAA
jgi:hypothetical protein